MAHSPPCSFWYVRLLTESFPGLLQEMYTLGMTPLPSGSLGLAWAPKFKPQPNQQPAEAPANGFGQRSWSVSEFFDEDGFFQEEAFEAEVRASGKTVRD